MSVQVIRDPVESFDLGLGYLQRFVSRESHSEVPPSHMEGYFALGNWVFDLRDRKDDLNPQQTMQIDAVKNWSWNKSTRRTRSDSQYDFAKGFVLLQDFVAVNGHARVHQLIHGETTDLGEWVRLTRNRGNSNRLSPAERQLVESQPGWVWSEQLAKFGDRVTEYRDYVLRTGQDLPRTYRNPITGYRLGNWVAKQKKAQADGTLSADRVALLLTVPSWSAA